MCVHVCVVNVCVRVLLRSSILLSYKLYTNAGPGGQADWCADCPRAEALNIRGSRAITHARARARICTIS